MTEDLNEINNKAYQLIAGRFELTTARSALILDYLDEMVRDIAADGLVLDIGCGSGYYTNFLNNKVKTVGLDVSPDMIREAKRGYPDVEFQVRDMRKLEFAHQTVDGITAVASLLHIPKQEAPGVLGEFRRVLKKEGRAVFVMKMPDAGYSGDGLESRVRSGIGVTRYFARYSEAEFEKLLKANGFEVTRHEIMHFSPSDPEPWMTYLTEVENG